MTFLAYHFDIGRGAYLKPAVFCEAIRKASTAGYTHFIPYLENMIRLEAVRKACPECAYTAEDWKHFQQVADECGIELVPHFNVIGHMHEICLAYPQYGGPIDRGLTDLDPTAPGVREWIISALDEFLSFSKSKYFLIGGDEWQAPQRLLRMPDVAIGELWVEHINVMVEHLARLGIKPIVWHDMMLHYPDSIAKLSKKAVVAVWFYDREEDYPALDTFQKNGFETIMAGGLVDSVGATFGTRVAEALACAKQAASKHGCRSLMVTSWGNARWEYQTLNIEASASVIAGRTIAAPLLEAIDLYQTLYKLPLKSKSRESLNHRLTGLLEDNAWDKYPELRELLSFEARGDWRAALDSFERFHYSEGPLYTQFSAMPSVSSWPRKELASIDKCNANDFEITASDTPFGKELRIVNGVESFNIYPDYGAALEGWTWNGHTLIENRLQRLNPEALIPGGYRSYNSAGGLRLIYSTGLHANPCIIWQHPWEWQIVANDDNEIRFECTLALRHVVTTITISVKRGESGLTYQACARNRGDVIHSALSFNLPLLLSEDDVETLRLGNGGTFTIPQKRRPAFWISERKNVTVLSQHWTMQVESSEEKTSGYFVDWGAGWVTPDLHGVFETLEPGQKIESCWKFHVSTPIADSLLAEG